jgi:hypothetical protein
MLDQNDGSRIVYCTAHRRWHRGSFTPGRTRTLQRLSTETGTARNVEDARAPCLLGREPHQAQIRLPSTLDECCRHETPWITDGLPVYRTASLPVRWIEC